MAASTDPNKIVGALDSMGSALDGSTPASIAGPVSSNPLPAPAWDSMSTAEQEAAPSIPASAFPQPAATPYKVPAANENDSVQGRVAGLISNNSDLMKLAAQSGQQIANRRGLQNSSIAAGASQAEVLKAATPIATADANIAAQKNLGREAQAASMEQLRQQLASSANQQDKDLAAQMTRLQTDAAAQMTRLQTQLSSSDAQQQVAIKAQMDQLNAQTAAQLQAMAAQSGYDITKLQVGSGLDIARDAAQAKNATDLAKVQGSIQSALQAQGNTEQIQRMNLDLGNQLQLQSAALTNDLQKISAAGDQDIRRLVEAANQERVTLQQSIAAQDRDRMATAMVNVFQIEAQMRASLLGNTNIPADERAAYEKSISALGDPIRDYINQLFGTSSTPTPAPTSPTSLPGTTTAPPANGTPASPGSPVITAPGGGLLQDTSPLTGNQMAYVSTDSLNGGSAPSAPEIAGGGNTTTLPGGLIPNINGLTSDDRRQLGFPIQ